MTSMWVTVTMECVWHYNYSDRDRDQTFPYDALNRFDLSAECWH